MATYDLNEAKEMLRLIADKQAPREAAHRQLVEDLLKLDGVDGLRVSAGPDGRLVEFERGRNTGSLLWWPERGGHYLAASDKHSPLRLEFDSASGRFVGPSDEPSRDPTAVIVEELLVLWGLRPRRWP